MLVGMSIVVCTTASKFFEILNLPFRNSRFTASFSASNRNELHHRFPALGDGHHLATRHRAVYLLGRRFM